MTLKSILLILLFLTHSNIYARKSNYYPESFTFKIKNLELKDGQLKNALFYILDGVHSRRSQYSDKIVKECLADNAESCFKQASNINYRQARKYLFGMIHLQKNQNGHFVKDLYCGKIFNEKIGVGKMMIPDSTHMNCEHTWPQSKFNKKMNSQMQKSDLHHLYPVFSPANSARSNYIFAEVDGQVFRGDCKISKTGYALDTNIRSFEPPNSHKGNVARSLFYFSIRYKLSISKIEESYLRTWHQQDPVDQFERKRNDIIEKIQKNRNPFIDFPNMVEEIDDF